MCEQIAFLPHTFQVIFLTQRTEVGKFGDWPQIPHLSFWRRFAVNQLRRTSLLALAATFALASTDHAVAKEEVPYKDSVLGVFEFVDEDTIAFDTVGQATQLGNFTSSGQLELSADLSFTGSNTLTAANGDMIFLEITSGSLTSIGGDIFIIELQTKFSGGTGRFENVTGGFSGLGELNLADQVFTGDGEGTISPPGKNKRR